MGRSDGQKKSSGYRGSTARQIAWYDYSSTKMRAFPAVLLALGATSAPSDDLAFMQTYTRNWGLLAAQQSGGLARSIDQDHPVLPPQKTKLPPHPQPPTPTNVHSTCNLIHPRIALASPRPNTPAAPLHSLPKDSPKNTDVAMLSGQYPSCKQPTVQISEYLPNCAVLQPLRVTPHLSAVTTTIPHKGMAILLSFYRQQQCVVFFCPFSAALLVPGPVRTSVSKPFARPSPGSVRFGW